MHIDDILNALTIDEKIQLLCGKDSWHLNGVERLNIPEILITDGPHGLRLSEGIDHSKTRPATTLPVASGIAASWNTELVYKMAKAVGKECQHYGVSVLLGPGVNGKRSPLGGRNFEYYSEDPYLSGKVATAFINGVQSEGVGACLKHFAGNEQETRRFRINSVIDERTFHEIYLAPFEMALKDAKPWTVMGAYNKVNGDYACENKILLEDILRDLYGFEGLIMSDWGAVVDKVKSVQNGLDLEMPGPQGRDHKLKEAFESGKLEETVIDTRVRNILKLIERALKSKQKNVEIDWNRHHELAVQLAEESMVLLKNEDILPIHRDKKVAVIGQFAKEPRFQGGGSSHMNPRELDIPLESMAAFGEVTYARGYTEEQVSDKALEEAVALAANNDVVVFFTGTTEKLESEGFDRPHMKLPEDHVKLLQAIHDKNDNVIVVLNCGSAIETAELESCSKAIVMAWLPGEGGGRAIANILYGIASPSGKLSETFPICLEHNPSYGYFPGTKTEVVYGEGPLVGYRYYDTKKLDVQYPFGHGLSYTSFGYSNLEVDMERKTVCVEIENTGFVAGAESVQIYVHDVKSTYFRPEKELKGFMKVFLEPGESKLVTIQLDKRAFSYFVPHLGRFVEENGEFIILAGASSRDIRLYKKMELLTGEVVQQMPNLDDTVNDWLNDERTYPKMKHLLDMMQMDENSPHYGIMLGMPIEKILWFYQMSGASEIQVDFVKKLLQP